MKSKADSLAAIQGTVDELVHRVKVLDIVVEHIIGDIDGDEDQVVRRMTQSDAWAFLTEMYHARRLADKLQAEFLDEWNAACTEENKAYRAPLEKQAQAA